MAEWLYPDLIKVFEISKMLDKRDDADIKIIDEVKGLIQEKYGVLDYKMCGDIFGKDITYFYIKLDDYNRGCLN